jgi:hypothetical protein
MMRWFILVLVISSLSLLIAAGGTVLHVRRQRRKARQSDQHVEPDSNEESLIDP